AQRLFARIDGYDTLTHSQCDVAFSPECRRANQDALEGFFTQEIVFAQRRPLIRWFVFFSDDGDGARIAALTKSNSGLRTAMSGANDNDIKGNLCRHERVTHSILRHGRD